MSLKDCITRFQDTFGSFCSRHGVAQNADALRGLKDDELIDLCREAVVSFTEENVLPLIVNQGRMEGLELSTLPDVLRPMASKIIPPQIVRNLLSSLIHQESDKDVLHQLSALATFGRPPDSVAPAASMPTRATGVRSFGTPVKTNTKVMTGSEQTRSDLHESLSQELLPHIYRTAQGFDEKFFQRKAWSSRAEVVYKEMKGRYVDNKWTGLEKPISQDTMLSWIFTMQRDFLLDEQFHYDSLEDLKRLTGGEAKRQIDVFLRPKSGDPSPSSHDWKQIRVIGELKASTGPSFKASILQLATYARDSFAALPTRRFLHAFLLRGDQMETFVFDRSGCYSPGMFNIHTSPERFIRTLAGYAMMDDDDAGLDTFIQTEGSSSFIALKEESSGEMTKLELNPKPLFKSHAIVSRATTVFSTKHASSDHWDCVTKFSWISVERKPESDLLLLANQRGVLGLPTLIGRCEIASIQDLRSGLVFGKRYSEDEPNPSTKRKLFDSNTSQAKRFKPASGHSGLRHEILSEEKTSLQNPPKAREAEEAPEAPEAKDVTEAEPEYINRILRCLVTSPAGRMISRFKTPLELITTLRDAIKAHQSLYTAGRILHRDVSQNNIIIVDPEQNEAGFSGMLIDLDMAQEMDGKPSGAQHRTGTMQFMAIHVLEGTCHTFREDLESFFYVLIWQCVRRDIDPGKYRVPGVRGRRAELPLTEWYRSTMAMAAGVKLKMMLGPRFAEQILAHFGEDFDTLKPLCKELRSILFPVAWFHDEPPAQYEPEEFYPPIIKAFDEAISKLAPA